MHVYPLGLLAAREDRAAETSALQASCLTRYLPIGDCILCQLGVCQQVLIVEPGSAPLVIHAQRGQG